MWAGVPVNAFALIFSAVALGIPYWAEYEHKSIGLKINYGLFQVCSDYIGCELTDPTFSMVAVCVLESIGTLLLLLSLIAASLKLCYSTNQPAFFKVAGVLSIVAALLIIIGVNIFGTRKELQTGKARNTDYMFHAGFFIAIIAALLSIIAGILFLVEPLLERRQRGVETFKARAPVVEYQGRILADDQMYNANGQIITHPYVGQPRGYYNLPKEEIIAHPGYNNHTSYYGPPGGYYVA